VNNSRAQSPVRVRALLALATALLAAVLAGCGSSGSSSTIGVNNQNTADNALIAQGETKTSSTEKTGESEAKTPTTGPLSKPPTVVPPTGPPPTRLQVKDLIPGTGKEVTSAKQSVTVNYTGVLFHGGKEFDSSWKRGEPATFQLSRVIPGWTKGMIGMRVGGRRELVIPAALAYGAAGSGSIPKNEPLVFVIDLLGTSA
jgi:peptidylprolyl isomerase